MYLNIVSVDPQTRSKLVFSRAIKASKPNYSVMMSCVKYEDITRRTTGEYTAESMQSMPLFGRF